ncbi:MAG: YgjP-like metallopeptidase domain-containing protein [Myxococcota bacterium]|nr:YgjP-like metallopeptidase domain-containing protein [Myxococcota bacterium]
MQDLRYLRGYPEEVTTKVQGLISRGTLGTFLLNKHPTPHEIRTNKALHHYVTDLKRSWLRKAPPVSRICYDDRIHAVNHALGLHTFVSRVQGSRLKAKHEIRVASVFKRAPLAFLRMIAVHELAHLKEKEHNRAFYNLCTHMEPDYHQLEFEMRLYLTHLELQGGLYENAAASSNKTTSS